MVLAGGEGVRLRPLIRQLYDHDLPKQYAVLTGGRSLLEQTLDRVALLVPPERTSSSPWPAISGISAGSCGSGAGPHVLAQPQDRGTGAAVLLAAHWIQARDPHAAMIVFSLRPLHP